MELFKILKNKKFIAAVILLLLLNCVCFYITQQRSIEEQEMSVESYSSVFSNNADVFTSKTTKYNLSKSLTVDKGYQYRVTATHYAKKSLFSTQKVDSTTGYLTF